MRGAIAAAAVLGVLLAGCGSDEEAQKAVVAAAKRTTGGGPVWIDQSVQLAPGRDRHGEVLVRGTADGRSRTARMTIATSTEDAGMPSASLTELESLDGDLAQRGETVFFNIPSLNRELDVTPGWIRIDADDPAAKTVGMAGVSNFGTLDPARPVDQLRAVEHVERVGTEDSPEGKLSHYKLHVDFGRYLEMVPSAMKASLGPEVAKLERGTGGTTFPAEVWVDDDDFLRRFDMKVTDRIGRLILDSRMDLEPASQAPAIPTRAVPLRKLAGG